MRHWVMAFAVVSALFAGAHSAEAGCSGGVGSATLSCTSNNGTLADYKSWVETTYVSGAVDKVMSTFATVYKPTIDGMTGFGQLFDQWGSANGTGFTYQYDTPNVDPYHVAGGGSSQKAGSTFLIDGATNSGNGANVYITVNWTGTVAKVINGATNYIASYTYSISSASAWGVGSTNTNQAWLQQVNSNASGSGTYNFSKATMAVPGPEAGTGLAGLAMAGVGFWAYRRRIKAA